MNHLGAYLGGLCVNVGALGVFSRPRELARGAHQEVVNGGSRDGERRDVVAVAFM